MSTERQNEENGNMRSNPRTQYTAEERERLIATAQALGRNLWVNEAIWVHGTEYVRRALTSESAPLMMRRFPRIRAVTFSDHGYRAFLRRTEFHGAVRQVSDRELRRFHRDLPILVEHSVERSRAHLLGSPRVTADELRSIAGSFLELDVTAS